MNYNFDSIAGYEVEKEELKRLCEIFNNREKYEKKGAKLPKGIVFYGEAGTGKTLFSKVLASVCGLEVFKIDLGDVENESAICRHIKKTFVKASKRKKPTMIFFDEVDKILPNDGERYYTDRSKTILTQLLTLIDGMDSSGNIVFVATCNYYDNLPETLTRPGRLDKKIGIGAPNFSSRVAILKMYAQKASCRFELPIEDIAKFTVGYTGAALETLVNECILQSDENGFISEELIRNKILEIKNEDIPKGRCAIEDTVIACRNLGAFVVAKTFNNGKYLLNLDRDTVCNDFFNNIISEFDDDFDSDYDDDDEFEDFDEDDDFEEEYECDVACIIDKTLFLCECKSRKSYRFEDFDKRDFEEDSNQLNRIADFYKANKKIVKEQFKLKKGVNIEYDKVKCIVVHSRIMHGMVKKNNVYALDIYKFLQPFNRDAITEYLIELNPELKYCLRGEVTADKILKYYENPFYIYNYVNCLKTHNTTYSVGEYTIIQDGILIEDWKKLIDHDRLFSLILEKNLLAYEIKSKFLRGEISEEDIWPELKLELKLNK